MPELPEVQTVVNDLNSRVSKRTILDFWTDTPKLIKSHSLESFKKNIKGMKISSVDRVGKNIFFNLLSPNKEEYTLLVHQKMTGHFLIGKWKVIKQKNGWKISNNIKGPMEDPYNKYIRAIFFLNNKDMLAFSDLRKFGKIFLVIFS